MPPENSAVWDEWLETYVDNNLDWHYAMGYKRGFLGWTPIDTKYIHKSGLYESYHAGFVDGTDDRRSP